jgi:hypothetical protein
MGLLPLNIPQKKLALHASQGICRRFANQSARGSKVGETKHVLLTASQQLAAKKIGEAPLPIKRRAAGSKRIELGNFVAWTCVHLCLSSSSGLTPSLHYAV